MYKLAVLNYAARRMKEDPRRSHMPEDLGQLASLSAKIEVIFEKGNARRKERLQKVTSGMQSNSLNNQSAP